MARFLGLFARATNNLGALEQQLDAPYEVESLTPELLYSKGARAVIFDHDGVLGPNFSVSPDETGKKLLDRFVDLFGENAVFVLSNTKSTKELRKQYYKKNEPNIHWIEAAPKPDPQGLLIAQSKSGVDIANISVIDDGLLTGILMAVESGAIPLYARRKSLPESFYAKLARLLTTIPQISIVKIVRFINTITHFSS